MSEVVFTDQQSYAMPLALGLDAGGTSTRWALANRAGTILEEGSGVGLTALMMGNETGRSQADVTFRRLAIDVRGRGRGAPYRVLAGISGYSGDQFAEARIQSLIGAAFDLPAASIAVASDVAVAYYDAFEPGQGYLVYAGTGSIAAYVDAQTCLHRVGGRGSLLDDGGSGHWIVREAMRHIWREEDQRPGSWRDSPMAVSVFDRIGGSEWTHSGEFIYQRSRGEVGELALAVAAAADMDAVARMILRQAGVELARLAKTLVRRFGPKPIALAGRAVQLHPLIEQGVREALPRGLPLRVVTLQAHQTAARLAARKQGPICVSADNGAASLTSEEPSQP